MRSAVLELPFHAAPGHCAVKVRLPDFAWAALAARAERLDMELADAVAIAVRAWVVAGSPLSTASHRAFAGEPSDQVLYAAITWWLDAPPAARRNRA